jgi:antitoxin VapB
MTTSTVFTNNRSQAVRLPADKRFPDRVKRVDVRVIGQERVITPIDAAWHSFFLSTPDANATEDFMAERADLRRPVAPGLDYCLECCATHSRKASFIRVCQPAPVALKYASTSGL